MAKIDERRKKRATTPKQAPTSTTAPQKRIRKTNRAKEAKNTAPIPRMSPVERSWEPQTAAEAESARQADIPRPRMRPTAPMPRMRDDQWEDVIPGVRRRPNPGGVMPGVRRRPTGGPPMPRRNPIEAIQEAKRIAAMQRFPLQRSSAPLIEDKQASYDDYMRSRGAPPVRRGRSLSRLPEDFLRKLRKFI